MRNDIAFSNALVANIFVKKGRMGILVGAERIFFLGLGQERVMSPGGVLFWAKCIGVLDRFLLEKDESVLELAWAFPKDSKEDTPNSESGGKKAEPPRNHGRGGPCLRRFPQNRMEKC